MFYRVVRRDNVNFIFPQAQNGGAGGFPGGVGVENDNFRRMKTLAAEEVVNRRNHLGFGAGGGRQNFPGQGITSLVTFLLIAILW